MAKRLLDKVSIETNPGSDSRKDCKQDMSGSYYREETRDESGSDQGSCNDHDVGIDTDDFVWKMLWKRSADLRTSVWT